jgi:molecular chaperone GrpE (heat shock protein)
LAQQSEPERHDTPEAIVEAAESKARLAEERLESAMEGYRALRDQTADLQEQLRGAQAEVEKNAERLKKQYDRERQRDREAFYRKYLEILDNFDRAFDTPDARAASPSLMEGFILVRNQLLAIIRERGLERIRTLGLAYDPATSEAVQVEDVTEPKRDGLVIRELVRGYQFEGRVMRAAQVVVGRYVGAPIERTDQSGEFVPLDDLPQLTSETDRDRGKKP